MKYADLSPELFGLGIQRGALFELLKNADPNQRNVQLDTTLVSIDRGKNCLTTLGGQQIGPFDLIVVADGTHSQLCNSFPELIKTDKSYPWGAVWCLIEDRRDPADPGRHQLQQRYRAAREMLGLLPVGRLPQFSDPVGSKDAAKQSVPSSLPTREKVCVFWSLPVARFAEWEFHGLGNWRSRVHQLWPEAADMLLQLQHPNEIAKASYRDVVMKQVYCDRVVFLGDSAHAMSPQLGQGANMALLDASTLARNLRDSQKLATALAGYDQQRREHVAIYQRLSRWLTPLFQSDSQLAAWLRDITFHPFSKLPPFKQQTLKVLTGLQRGWFGRYSP